MGNSPEHYFKTQKGISKMIGVILNRDNRVYKLRYMYVPYFSDSRSQKGSVLFVLCEQEITAFDLEAPK